MIPMHRNKTANIHQFSMIPKPEIPRSSFMRQFTHKTTFDENYLIPIYVDEVLPGDTFSLRMTAFARFATPIYPIMDNMYLDSFFFFVPCRLIWSHWQNFMGEQPNTPSDSTAYTIPLCTGINGGAAANSIYDYFGLPTAGQMTIGNATDTNALPLRAYNLIWNQWFRDENLQNAVGFGATNTYNDFGDGPDPNTNYALLKRGKRHDYFTACLPWTQKGGVVVAIPGSGSAIVKTSTSNSVTGTQEPIRWLTSTGANPASNDSLVIGAGGPPNYMGPSATAATGLQANQGLYPQNLYADLTTATIATVNALRLSFQTQKLLERDARGGTRYTEIVRAHFGVISPDARLQRPEYLGGGTTPVSISPIPQTSATNLTGGTSPLGTLSAYGTILSHGHGFTQSFTEHGYIIGLVNIRADLTYQQGKRRLWDRSTRYDFYFPEFAMLGEQAVTNREIYCVGSATGGHAPADQDSQVFGYQERWAEYRYLPNMITGQFRSTYATPLDTWHLAEKFTALPTLSSTFIPQNTPISRVVAVNTAGSHFIFDSLFACKTTRPMPLYSVPGLIDHF